MSTLDPNRFAAPVEAALLRHHIALDEAARPAIQQRVIHAKTTLHDALCALRLAQEAVDSAQAIHDEVLAIQDALEQRLRRARGLLHPVRRLPDDVLSMIFSAWLSMAHGVWGSSIHRPFRIGLYAAAVCARWRRLALHLPRLWSFIKLDLAFIGQANVATWIEYIKTILARASATPVELDISGPPGDVESLRFWTAVYNCFAKAGTIILMFSGDRPSRHVNRCLSRHAPRLERLSLCYDLENEQDSDRLPFFFSAPLLRTLDWQGPRISWPLTLSTYPAVTRAEILSAHMDAEGLGELLGRMPQIHTLTTTTSDFAAGNTTASFALNSDTLDELHWISDGLDTNLMRRITFPSLRLAKVEFPEGEPAHDAVAAMLQHTMPGVQHLDLSVEAAVELITGLRFLSQLRYLALVGYGDSADQFFDELACPDAGGTWLCPRLEELRLRPGRLKPPLRQSILRVARARGGYAPVDRQPPTRLISISFGSRVDAQFLAQVEEALGSSQGH